MWKNRTLERGGLSLVAPSTQVVLLLTKWPTSLSAEKIKLRLTTLPWYSKTKPSRCSTHHPLWQFGGRDVTSALRQLRISIPQLLADKVDLRGLSTLVRTMLPSGSPDSRGGVVILALKKLGFGSAIRSLSTVYMPESLNRDAKAKLTGAGGRNPDVLVRRGWLFR